MHRNSTPAALCHPEADTSSLGDKCDSHLSSISLTQDSYGAPGSALSYDGYNNAFTTPCLEKGWPPKRHLAALI